MKNLFALALALVGLTAFADSPIIRNNFSTNSSLSAAQFAAGMNAGALTGGGAVVLSNAPIVQNLDSLVRARTPLLSAGSIVFTNGTASTGIVASDTSGALTVTTNVPNIATTNIVVSGTAKAATLNATAAAFNTIKQTNGAVAGLVTSDSSGNFSMSAAPGISGVNITNINWIDTHGKWYEFAWQNNGSAAGEPAYGITAVSKNASDGSNFRNGTATNLSFWEPFTSSTSNRTFSIAGTAQFFASQNLHIMFTAGCSNSANYQFWCGWSSDTGPNMVGKTNQTGDFIGFEFSPLLNDPAIMLISRNNATTTRSSTGIAFTGAPTRFTLIGNNDGTSWSAYINNTQVTNGYTTTLPRTSVALNFTWGGSNQTNEVRHGKIYLVKGRATYPYP